MELIRRDLDLTLEPDEIDLDRIRELLAGLERRRHPRVVICRLLMRRVQLAGLRETSIEPRLMADNDWRLHGIPIVVVEDGRTPRERQLARVERDRPRTRREQIAAFFEREGRQAELRDSPWVTEFAAAHEYDLLDDGELSARLAP